MGPGGSNSKNEIVLTLDWSNDHKQAGLGGRGGVHCPTRPGSDLILRPIRPLAWSGGGRGGLREIPKLINMFAEKTLISCLRLSNS